MAIYTLKYKNFKLILDRPSYVHIASYFLSPAYIYCNYLVNSIMFRKMYLTYNVYSLILSKTLF